MTNKKVAIIGAGISGLYLGWKLAEKGCLVSVFEKEKKIEEKACSGLFSEKILKFIPQSSNLIENTISYVILHFPKKEIRIKFSEKFYVMSHFKLDILAANLAQKKGVKINFNRSISNLPEGFDKIIGCDGAYSLTRRKLNLPEPQYRLGILGFSREKSSLNCVEAWACSKGFIWKIPRGEKTEYGIMASPKEAKIIFEQFLSKNKISIIGKQSRIIPQGLIVPFSSSVTLCGDSAGLTKPWSGGGVVWGLTAAEMLLKTFPNFLDYYWLMKKKFFFRIIFSKITTKIVYFIGFNFPFFLPKKVKIESDFLL